MHAYRHQGKKRGEQGVCRWKVKEQENRRGRRTAEDDREKEQETETEGDRVRNTSLLQGTLSAQLMRREF